MNNSNSSDSSFSQLHNDTDKRPKNTYNEIIKTQLQQLKELNKYRAEMQNNKPTKNQQEQEQLQQWHESFTAKPDISQSYNNSYYNDIDKTKDLNQQILEYKYKNLETERELKSTQTKLQTLQTQLMKERTRTEDLRTKNKELQTVVIEKYENQISELKHYYETRLAEKDDILNQNSLKLLEMENNLKTLEKLIEENTQNNNNNIIENGNDKNNNNTYVEEIYELKHTNEDIINENKKLEMELEEMNKNIKEVQNELEKQRKKAEKYKSAYQEQYDMVCYFAERQFNIKSANKMKLDLILSKIDEKYRKDVIESNANRKSESESDNEKENIIPLQNNNKTLENELKESQKQISTLQKLYSKTVDDMNEQKKQYNKMYQKMVELTEANNNLRNNPTPNKNRVVIKDNKQLSPYQIKIDTLHRKTVRTPSERSNSIPITKKKTIHVSIPSQIPIEKENPRLIKPKIIMKKKKKNTKPVLGRQVCFGVKY